MKTQKIIGAIIILAIFVYVAYRALPLLIGFSTNILSFSFSVIILIAAIYFIVKGLFK